MAKGILDGVRILDSTYIFAMPYALGVMADMGAEVIKVEGPSHSEPLRRGGTGAFADNDPGEDWWNRAATYNLIHRGKRSLTLDLTREEGRDVLKELIKVSDVFVENNTPRVLRRWGLDYPNIKKIKPDIIMVSNTGYGHGEGPYSMYPAQATTQESTHGLTHITGYQGDMPSKAGNAYVDFLACWSGLLGVAMALRHRNRTGQGQWIDIGMYQLGCITTSEYIMDWQANGRLGGRIGNRHPSRAPQGTYPCVGDDQWCVISVGDDEEWAALCREMERPELIDDPRFETPIGRMKNHDQLDEIISQWTSGLDRYHIMEQLQGVGVPSGPVFDSRDSNLDPHKWATGFLEKVVFPEERNMGTRVLMGRPWHLDKTPPQIQRPAPKMGEDNDDILHNLLGLSEEQTIGFLEESIISEWPTDSDNVYSLTPEEQRRRGIVAYHDPDYKEKLGI